MGTVKPKDGLSNAFFGAVAGFVLLEIIQVITSASNANNVQMIPKLTFDANPFKFMGDYLGYFFTTAPGLLVLVGTILFYGVGTYYIRKSQATPPDPDVVENDTAAFMRGLLIFFASGMNFALAYNIYGTWFNQTIGLVIALILFVLGIIASIKEVSQNGVYQGIIGWLCWLAPMSWPVLILGLILLVVSAVLGLLWWTNIDFLKVGGDKTDPTVDPSVQGKRLIANWATGTFFLIGGVASNANPRKTAYNMGNVGFIHRKAKGDYRNHESGHNLNLFAFGWIFHYVGALDEAIGYHAQALAELPAESHNPGTAKANLEMWT